MISYPNAKINIGLNIVEKRTDGYHNIESIFCPIPLFDILEINRSEGFLFSTSGYEIPGNANENLIIKAYRLLKEKYTLPPVSIHLHKQIPMGAGLGGGSADAAFTLTMLNELFNLQITNRILEKYALELGSDCPFFIENKPKFVTGTGDKMDPIDIDLNKYYLLIINSGIHIGTQEAYAGIQPKSPKKKLTEIDLHTPKTWQNQVVNDFEDHIFKLHPQLNTIKEDLYKQGAIYVSMTGSGSTIYGIFNEKPKLHNQYFFEKVLVL